MMTSLTPARDREVPRASAHRRRRPRAQIRAGRAHVGSNELERIDHVRVDDANDGNGGLLDCRAESIGDRLQGSFGFGDIERELTNGKIVRIDDAGYEFRIRNCWLRATAAIGCRPWICPGANRSNVKRADLIEPRDGPTSGTYLNNVDDWRAHRITKFGARPFEFIFRCDLGLPRSALNTLPSCHRYRDILR